MFKCLFYHSIFNLCGHFQSKLKPNFKSSLHSVLENRWHLSSLSSNFIQIYSKIGATKLNLASLNIMKMVQSVSNRFQPELMVNCIISMSLIGLSELKRRFLHMNHQSGGRNQWMYCFPIFPITLLKEKCQLDWHRNWCNQMNVRHDAAILHSTSPISLNCIIQSRANGWIQTPILGLSFREECQPFLHWNLADVMRESIRTKSIQSN